MSRESILLYRTLIRLLKGCLTALERWVDYQESRCDAPPRVDGANVQYPQLPGVKQQR